MTLRVALFCRPHELPSRDLRTFIEVARLADEAGFYALSFGDHVVMSDNPEQYPYGPFAHSIETPWLEPNTAFAAIASVTRNIRLSSSVLLTPLRPPALLAKTIATLDVLSNGRVEPGIGIGWQSEEYRALGLDWSKRHRLFDDGIRACRALWEREPPVYFESETVHLEKVWAYPRPIQARIPLLYGVAATARHARRIAELGDGWCPVAVDAEGIRSGVALIRAAFAERGRDPSTLIVRAGLPTLLDTHAHVDVERTLAGAPALLEAGVTVVQIGLPATFKSLSEIERFLGQIGAVAATL